MKQVIKNVNDLIQKFKDYVRNRQDKNIIKELVKDIEETTFKHILERVLENEVRHINNELQCSKTHRPINKKISLLITKKIFTQLKPLFEIIGVQPMSGPVGLVYMFQYRNFGDNQDKVMLDIVSHAVEAFSQKLQTKYTIELMQDIKTIHNLDIEAEICCFIGTQISYEITNLVLNDLIKLAKEHQDIEKLSDEKPIESLSRTTISCLNNARNNIAKRTKRGCGNFVVTTPTGLAFLDTFQEKIGCKFVKFEPAYQYQGALTHVGNFVRKDGNIDLKVFLAISSGFLSNNIEFLVGYKGTNGEVDTPYILSPYIPLMSSGVVIDPNTFQPYVSFMFCQGKYISKNAKDYYCIIEGITEKEESNDNN